MLSAAGKTVSAAESCTGGMISSLFTSIPGSSEYYLGSVTSYANSVKSGVLGVPQEIIETHGAVSEETAREMAEGGVKAANADAALSVTGIAGPGGGTKEKPVGLVYIGCYVNGKTIVKKNLFTGNRREVREQAVETALKLLLECLP
jgi:PncC family amidohydrolase